MSCRGAPLSGPPHPHFGRALRLFALATYAFAIGPALAATSTWNGGGGDANWSTGGNWTGGTPVGSSTTDIIFAGSTNTGTSSVPLNQNIANPLVLNSLAFSANAGNFFLSGLDLRFGGANNTITQNSSNAQSIANIIRGPSSGVVTLTLAGDGTGLVTMSGAIESGTGGRDYAVVKSGNSTFLLSGVNTYAGGTTINAGTLAINNAASLGATSGALTINAGTLEVTTGFTSTRATTVGNAASTFQIDPAQTFTVNAVIGGTGALNKTGSGTMVLGGVNTYSGGTTVSAGTLRISASERLANSGGLTVSGGIFDVQTFTETVNAVSLTSGSITGSGTGTLVGSAYGLQSGTVSAILGGAAVLTKTTAGTVTLSGANTYTGGTAINGGTLSLTSSGALGSSGTIGFGGGTLQYSATNTTDYSSRFSGAVNQAYSIDTNGQNVTLASALTSSGGTFTKLGSGTLTLSGINTYNGGTTVSAGTLQMSAVNRLLSTGALTVSGGTFNLQTFSQALGAVTLSSGSITGTGAGALTGSSYTLQSGTVSAILAGVGAVTKNTAGTVTLSGVNLYTGATTVSAGTLQLNANNALGTTLNGTTVANGAALKLNGINYSTAEALTLNGSGISNAGALTNTGTSTFAGAINIATNATISAGGGTLNLSGGIAKNGTTLTIAGGGTVNILTNGITGSSANSDLVVDGTTVILSASNSYNGPTTVQNSGTLKLGASNVLPTSPQTAMTINTSSVFDLASFSDGVASLAGDSTATVKNSVAGGTGTLTVNPATGISTTFAGVIAGTNGGAQGNVALLKTGAGTLVLTGTNTYSGSTVISGGTLTAAGTSGAALGLTSSITVNSGGTLLLGAGDQINNTATVTLNGGTIVKTTFSEGSTTGWGMGALTLTASGAHIDFGSSTVGVLSFASFNPGANVLNIDNWTGAANTIGNINTDRLVFDSDQTSNLNNFWFAGYAPGASQFSLGNGYYELTPTVVPEPATWIPGALGLGAIGACAVTRMQKRRKKARADQSAR
jgi:autotransporter-associated beta strand protein